MQPPFPRLSAQFCGVQLAVRCEGADGVSAWGWGSGVAVLLLFVVGPFPAYIA
ncbi:hypothetical protein SAMN02910314_01064 [Denitrobacterium detoxificans]|uniref:Uncharacterized protein n=1 Tax=Denitrobacterium detoxificans TaxID=79604 RepID=A0A1H8S7R7_9ACTN|nr:hypothetical protein SAMN02910314_01064 [Denitrobacterium detoxificans]